MLEAASFFFLYTFRTSEEGTDLLADAKRTSMTNTYYVYTVLRYS